MIKHTLKYLLLFVSILLFSTNNSSAQYYTLGADPASAKWMQLKSDNYSIIYPAETDSIARRFLYLFEKNRANTQLGLNIEMPKVPLVLHPYTTQSNGSVVWAPKRIELISTPPSSGGYAQNWEEQLAIHEGRHLGQMAHYTRKTFSVFHFLFGEQSIALGTGFYPSGWFLEGDATLNETDFSIAGRGRSASFLSYFRASFIQGDFRDYDHWRFGSYKYYTPNKYAFGYLLSSTMRYMTGNYYVSGDIMDRLVQNWWHFFSVWNKSFREATGRTMRKNWRLATNFMTDVWVEDYLSRGCYTPFYPISSKNDPLYVTYSNPLPLGSGTLALKSGYEHSRHLISIDSTGREKEIRTFAAGTSAIIPDRDSCIIWSETVPDIRWGLRTYSIIRSYDLKTNRFSDITTKTRYFNPSLSKTKDSLVVVEYPITGGSNYVLLDKVTGTPIFTKRAPADGQITKGVLMNNTAYAVVITDKGLGVYKTDIADSDSEWSVEIPEQSRYIYNFKVIDSCFYFISDLDGVNNAYLYNPQTKLLRRLTNSRFGASNPTFNKETDELYYVDYDILGYHPVKTPTDSLDWSIASFDKPFKHKVAEVLASQTKLEAVPITAGEDSLLIETIDSIQSRPYKKGQHLFNFHSWAPFYANVNRIMKMSYDQYYQLASLGATVLSQNTLGTAIAQLGYSYHKGFHSGHLNFNYSGIFPVFELAVDYNDRYRMNTIIEESHVEPERYPIKYTIDTTNVPSLDISLTTYVPLNLSKSGWNSGLIPQFSIDFSNDRYSIFGAPLRYRQSLSYGIRYYRMQATTKTALFPRWGFGASFNGRSTYGPHNRHGNIAYAYLYGYLPGITRQQGIKLSATYQKQFTNDLFGYLPNIASVPRGYKKFILMDYAKFTFDYAIPIYLGDVSWPWLYYLKRLQVVPFTDLAVDKSHTYPEKGYLKLTPDKFLYSYGADVLLDFHFIRIGTELSLGFRYARTGEKNNYYNILFSTDLY
ncbi:MAG: hypothetical protein PHD11_00665 [Bacteroidales bacterium]|nr:hypothetical protein [Bacteroidales bacterium]MDD4670684.1 hypothetical protein [Bacteroidales bacterium]